MLLAAVGAQAQTKLANVSVGNEPTAVAVNPVTSGTVTFLNGTGSVGTGMLNAQGVATLTVTTLPVGSDSLTASFATTVNAMGSTSSAVTVSVMAAGTSMPPSYSLSASPSSLTIVQGQTGNSTLTFTPAGGYSGTLTLACGNLPAFVTCTFT